eukprot:TRINITY_DN7087_c0_g1_i2.p2 TRINITY_DN7087_c0_g1~~TRINITY_DN7087_c0_g1_i2.p2  ORF type:complete len:390 (+),score=44.08 TRINITY_DN7087_c0_g1_i2:35-1204(+)
MTVGFEYSLSMRALYMLKKASAAVCHRLLQCLRIILFMLLLGVTYMLLQFTLATGTQDYDAQKRLSAESATQQWLSLPLTDANGQPAPFNDFDDGDDIPNPSLPSKQVPCLIHQTYKSYEQLPPSWRAASKEWQQRHRGCKYVFWSDRRLRRLIARYYAWFLSTYDGYPRVIQRVDAARYFILHAYGGLYADLDIRPRTSLQRVIENAQSRFAFDYGMGLGVSNDLMVAGPGHPFATHLLTRLRPHARDFLVPYVTVLLSAGSLFATVAMQDYYHATRASELAAFSHCLESKTVWPIRHEVHTFGAAAATSCQELISVGRAVGRNVWHQTGNSWHAGDANFILTAFEWLKVTPTWRLFLAAVALLVAVFAAIMPLFVSSKSTKQCVRFK